MALDLTLSAISSSGSGDTTTRAAVTGKRIRVWRLFLQVEGSTNITFKSGSTSLSGAISLPADGDSLTLDRRDEPWFVTGVAEAFIINSSAAVVVGGMAYSDTV